MNLFETYLKDGSVVQGENWDEVSAEQIKVLVVHHPWAAGVSMALQIDEGVLPFLWKEAIGQVGKAGQMTRVGFGKLKGVEIAYQVIFSSDGGIRTLMPY